MTLQGVANLAEGLACKEWLTSQEGSPHRRASVMTLQGVANLAEGLACKEWLT